MVLILILLKGYRDVLQHDIFDFVIEFFEKSKIHSGYNSSFITLIPKIGNSMVINNYRPIRLIGISFEIMCY